MTNGYHTSWIVPPEHRASDAYRLAGLQMQLAEAVYARRTALGWTTAQLAAAAHMDEADIERIEESDMEPSIPLIQRLALAMHAGVTLRIDPESGDEFSFTFEAA